MPRVRKRSRPGGHELPNVQRRRPLGGVVASMTIVGFAASLPCMRGARVTHLTSARHNKLDAGRKA